MANTAKEEEMEYKLGGRFTLVVVVILATIVAAVGVVMNANASHVVDPVLVAGNEGNCPLGYTKSKFEGGDMVEGAKIGPVTFHVVQTNAQGKVIKWGFSLDSGYSAGDAFSKAGNGHYWYLYRPNDVNADSDLITPEGKDLSHASICWKTAPTATPTNTSTNTPTNTPTDTATSTPTDTPTNTPTDTPTDDPTIEPTVDPTQEPTEEPTVEPTIPTAEVTFTPTVEITLTPTQVKPTLTPTTSHGVPPWSGCRNERQDLASFTNYDEYYSDWMWIDGGGNRHLAVHDIHSVKISDGKVVVEVPEGMTGDTFVMILYRRSDGVPMLEIVFDSCLEAVPTPRPAPSTGSLELPPGNSGDNTGPLVSIAAGLVLFASLFLRRRNNQ